jgi:hypothetical protein
MDRAEEWIADLPSVAPGRTVRQKKCGRLHSRCFVRVPKSNAAALPCN